MADHLQAGEAFADIARATGTTPSAVRWRGRRLGIESKRAGGGGNLYDGATYERILRLKAAGLSYAEVARATGVNRNACIGVVRRRGAGHAEA